MNNNLKSKTRLSFVQIIFQHLSTKNDVSGKEFFVNRFARLYPLHFATLIIVAILQFINWSTTNSFQIVHFNDFYHFHQSGGIS